MDTFILPLDRISVVCFFFFILILCFMFSILLLFDYQGIAREVSALDVVA